MEIFHHQQAAMDEIVIRATTFYAGQWENLTIQPRFASLLAGPTGSGKTTIARLAAEKLGAKLLRLSMPGYMPAGAHNRGTKETINIIADFVARHDRTLLVLDEIDKLIGGSTAGSGMAAESWQSYIKGEIYDLCDGRWPTGLILMDDDEMDITIEALTVKLRESVFILGIGTFQSWFDDAVSRRSIGFTNTDDTDGAINAITADVVAEMMPRELANRFNGALIRIPELCGDDYLRVIDDASAKLPGPIRQAFVREAHSRLQDAIKSKKGVRFLEEAVMEALKEASIVCTVPATPSI